eukprot:m.484453 g.484453  ORF g.484453 m.484453 type:complete len:71 (+) comp21731_c3_seq10:2467-2679(+)
MTCPFFASSHTSTHTPYTRLHPSLHTVTHSAVRKATTPMTRLTHTILQRKMFINWYSTAEFVKHSNRATG